MTEIVLPITMTFVAVYAIVVGVMIGWIGTYRGKINVLRGDGQDAKLFKRSRIHGNLTEIAPVAIFSVGMGEALGLAPVWLWAVVVAFVVGRVFHYISFDNKIRGLWMGMSALPSGAIGIWSLFQIW